MGLLWRAALKMVSSRGHVPTMAKSKFMNHSCPSSRPDRTRAPMCIIRYVWNWKVFISKVLWFPVLWFFIPSVYCIICEFSFRLKISNKVWKNLCICICRFFKKLFFNRILIYISYISNLEIKTNREGDDENINRNSLNYEQFETKQNKMFPSIIISLYLTQT